MNPLHRFRRSSWSPRLWVRLALGFGALLLLMAAVVVLAILQFRELAAHSDELMRHDLQRMLRVQEIHQHAQGHGNAMARLLTARRSEREAIYPLVDAEYATVDRLLEELAQKVTDAEESRLLALVVEHRSQYREIFSDVVVWIESEEPQQASAMFNDAAQPALKLLLDAADALLLHEQAAMAARQQTMQDEIRASEWLLASLAAGAVALSVLLAWRTTGSVAGPLGRVEAAAHRIAEGNYATRVHVRGSNELGKVAQAMNSMASAVATREAEIERLAYVDRLTGLPNRTLLLAQARDKLSSGLSVILMDVARLRVVNEVLGFETGDAMLRRIAERLRAVVASQAVGQPAPQPARLAGGVFVLLCKGMDRASIEALRGRIDDALLGSIDIDGHAVDVNLVFGLADAEGELRHGIDGLLRDAELAVGEAKRSRHNWAWHVPVDDTARARQLSLLSSLRSAAMSGELEMWLQPKQCLRSGRLVGMEGLVRWRHPERGYISPAEFVPFAERTGHIGVVTRAMLDAALATLARWQKDQPALSIAINVSAIDIQDDSFAERVAQIALQHGAPLDRLRLEITESSLMEDADRALPVLLALRRLGVQLSIDDFGTGYSSLAYLKRLPVNELKIDRSFVAGADLDADARALLRTIIDLGHSLNMCVTAEGIEREQERALLAELGCDQAQGYLISRPMDPRAAERHVLALTPASAELALAG